MANGVGLEVGQWCAWDMLTLDWQDSPHASQVLRRGLERHLSERGTATEERQLQAREDVRVGPTPILLGTSGGANARSEAIG